MIPSRKRVSNDVVTISFEHRKRHVSYHYEQADKELAEQLAKKLQEELGEFLKGVVFFGSAARGSAKKGSDLDVLLILNDLTIVMSKEVVTSLRVIIENTAASVSPDFHVTTLQLSQFWDYVRQGDPVLVNMLREGVAVYDEGFFTPLQFLLDQGKIRPSKEAIWAYYNRAPKTIKNAEWHLLQAIVDLYWAVIDAAHAVLMHIDVVPGAPHRVGDLLEKHFVRKRLLDKKYVKTLRHFYNLAKDVGHHQLTTMSGKDIDTYILQAHDFIKRMKFLLDIDKEKLLA